MALIIKEGEKNKHFEVKIKPKKEGLFRLRNLAGDEPYQWLLDNGYKEVAERLTFKQVFAATLSDFLQFIYASLISSEKGHLAVTYSLLRKPLKENLFILELLLSKPVDFFIKFNSKTSYKDIAIDEQPPDH